MDNYPKSVTRSQTQIIFNQMNNSFYKIQGKDKKLGIGVFCKIKIKNKSIFVLMTSYNIIDEIYVEQNDGIKIIINNELNLMKFGDKSLNYINKKNNISIIEIKEIEKFKINFLEIDKSLYEDELSTLNNKETIYIIHHNNTDKEISVSYGIIRFINKYEISLACNINTNGSIAPIFNSTNNKLLGFYYNASKYFIKGIILKMIIDKFNKIIRMHKNINEDKNEIDILIKIHKEDINKEIYFLNNKFIKNYKPKNKLNAELYINERLYKNNKYFKPSKEGEYKIKLNLILI